MDGLTGRTWLRVPEEERGGADDTGRVYRPEGHPLPPARGREGLTFHSDGRFDYRDPGGGGTATGTWHGVPGGVRADVAGERFALRITELTDDVLRLEWPHP